MSSMPSPANRPPIEARVIEWVLVGLGTFLIAGIGGVCFVVARIIARSGNPESTTRFAGHAIEAAAMYGVFGLVLMFGVVTVLSGVSRIRYGKIDRRQLVPVLWMFGALLVFGELLLWIFRA
jgi:hypothetical protein